MKVDAFFWGLSPLYKTPSLHVIEKLAVSFNVQPYELLYPRELDAKNANPYLVNHSSWPCLFKNRNRTNGILDGEQPEHNS